MRRAAIACLLILGVAACHRQKGMRARDAHHPSARAAQSPTSDGVAAEPQDDAAPAGRTFAAPAAAKEDTRKFTFNGRAATASDLRTLAEIERMYGRPAPEGSYWYDRTSGAAGRWGGPTLGFLPAGLDLGGPLPPNASGGGDGRLTGVFINGREIHPVDWQFLNRTYGQVLPGRWWVDGQGNAGREGGPPLLNLIQLARQRAAQGRGSGAEHYYRSDGTGNNAFVGGGCVSVNTKVGDSSYSYIGSGC